MWSDRLIRGASLPDQTLCLTFDDGPGDATVAGGESQTVELGYYLSEERISATFFFVGAFLREHAGVPERLRELGHTIGNHTFSHCRMNRSSASDAELRREVVS